MWWKTLSAVLILFSLLGGMLMTVPRMDILNETIRNLYYHVPLWFGMTVYFLISAVYSVDYLRRRTPTADIVAAEYARTGMVYGILGLVTGMIWANYTWGAPWHGDPKQTGAAITLFIFLAYFVLRNSVENEETAARLSAVYNLFAFLSMIPLLFVMPRMTSSMHPGSGGNPGFNMYDLDSSMRIVFYPAAVGWILLGVWITTLHIRVRKLNSLP